MIIDYKLTRYNIRLLNLDYILKKSFDKYNHDISLYGIRNHFKHKDTQKIFINSFIVTLCDRIKAMALREPVAIYINRNTRHIPKEEFDIVFNLIHRALKKLPFQFIIGETSVDFFIDGIHNNVVDKVVTLETQLYYSNNFDVLKFSFRDLIKFLKSYNLCYLYDVYFKQLSNKLLVVR